MTWSMLNLFFTIFDVLTDLISSTHKKLKFVIAMKDLQNMTFQADAFCINSMLKHKNPQN
jgi:hypothetical protein